MDTPFQTYAHSYGQSRGKGFDFHFLSTRKMKVVDPINKYEVQLEYQESLTEKLNDIDKDLFVVKETRMLNGMLESYAFSCIVPYVEKQRYYIQLTFSIMEGQEVVKKLRPVRAYLDDKMDYLAEDMCHRLRKTVFLSVKQFKEVLVNSPDVRLFHITGLIR